MWFFLEKTHFLLVCMTINGYICMEGNLWIFRRSLFVSYWKTKWIRVYVMLLSHRTILLRNIVFEDTLCAPAAVHSSRQVTTGYAETEEEGLDFPFPRRGLVSQWEWHFRICISLTGRKHIKAEDSSGPSLCIPWPRFCIHNHGSCQTANIGDHTV